MKIFSFKNEILNFRITVLNKNFYIHKNSLQKVKQNYQNKLKELKNKENINIAFLVTTPSKWQYQSVYEELSQYKNINVIVLITTIREFHKKKKFQEIEADLKNCSLFFKNKKINFKFAYDIKKRKFIDLKNFSIDILFYEQPWEVFTTQHPYYVSKFALTCYCPYGMHVSNFDGNYLLDFHQLLWCMFIENSEQKKEFSSLINKDIDNCEICGTTKLDGYLKNNRSYISSQKPIVIFAPHHSFVSNSALHCGTFNKNYIDMLEIAKYYKDVFFWVFKPHPVLKDTIINTKLMNKDEVNAYYQEWATLGKVEENGDYIPLFKESSAMITDCVSFLGEYLPSMNPLFHLIGENQPFSNFAKQYINTYYSVKDTSELKQYIEEVLIKQNDFKKEERISKIPLIFNKNETTGHKIIQFLLKNMQ